MDVTLLFVFDGCRNPTKSGTNDDRQKKKKEAKDLLIDALKHEGATSLNQISSWYKAATSIDEEMVGITLDWCNQNGVRYIQAPMEADPLLFSLESQSIIDGIISEDSDNIPFGCQKTYPECKNINCLRFDFCVNYNDTEILVEYNGIQHYEPVSIFGGELALQKTQKNDNIKYQYTKDENIPLIVIPHNKRNRKEITNFLDEEFKKVIN
jgi:5'-3' exonuclease